MLTNYFKIAFRNLLRNRSYAFINIVGLAIGIVCTALIFLWVEDELNFNAYFTNKNHLYRVKNTQSYDGQTYVFDATPGPLAASIKADVPGVKSTARTTWNSQLLFSVGNKNVNASGLYADSSLFDMLSLEFIEGSADKAFSDLYSLVLTEKAAKKFFGSGPVFGKMLKVNNGQSYTISGVVKDLPKNVSFNFDWLAPFTVFEKEQGWLQTWGNNGILTYVELQDNASEKNVNILLHSYIQRKSNNTISKLSIYPMSRWRLYNNFDNNGQEIEGSIKYVRLFSIIAWIILFIACINFMNLATASSEKRSREVGVRKALGSGKNMLILQFLSESIVMSLIAAILALFIMYLALPSFNTLVQKDLHLNVLSPVHLLALLGITVLCGLLAGSYPAFYLSSFNPIAVLKGNKLSFSNGGAGLVRKGLVVLQFCVSITLIICTLVIYRQIQHIKTRDLGYNKEGLMYLGVQGKVYDNFNGIKNDLLKMPAVKNACLSSGNLLQLGSNSGDFIWPGKDVSKSTLITLEFVTPEYVSTNGLNIKAGRDFYQDGVADSNNVIINESLARLIGNKAIVGSQIYRPEGTRYTIVGVIKDFIYNSMYGQAEPMILFADRSNVNYLSIRLNAGINTAQTLAGIESVFKKYNPGYPFEYAFTDEQFDRMFRIETLINKLAGIFAVLAVFISCLGLFGLTSYIAERRAKEMSIRKVLGASVQLLTMLLTRDFLKLVLIACLLAFPIAAYFMYNWLNDYEYHVELNAWLFVLAGALALLIALLTVGVRAVRTALTNPIKNLRTE